MGTDAALPPTVPADDIGLEASRLTEAALTARLDLRLMGGLGVWLTSPSVRRPPYARQYQDLDFAASSSHRSRVAAFFESMGYRPERMFNALHGARRLNFLHPERRWSIDVIFDELRMSHRIDLRGRLGGPGPTLDLADLLLRGFQRLIAAPCERCTGDEDDRDCGGEEKRNGKGEGDGTHETRARSRRCRMARTRGRSTSLRIGLRRKSAAPISRLRASISALATPVTKTAGVSIPF